MHVVAQLTIGVAIVTVGPTLLATQQASGTLTGRVVDAVSREPIAGAVVSITRINAGPIGRDAMLARARQGRPPTILTAEDGSFFVPDVAPGSFWLRARKAGYIGGFFGQGGPAADDPVQSFDLRAGEHAKGIVLPLWKGGSVMGRVLSSNGDPLAGRWVQALRLDTSGPRLELRPQTRAASSNANGDYRIGDLQPGRYLVRVSASEPRTSGSELLALLSPRSPLRPVDPSDAAHYYPNAPSPTEALLVTLGPGEDALAIDVTLPASRVAASVSGRIVGVPTGFVDCRVRLLASGPTRFLGDEFEIAATDARSDGSFVFAHVPPGTYVVRGIAWQGGVWFSQTVAVGDTPVTGLELTAVPGARITGRIVSDDDRVPLTADELRDLQVFVRPLDGWNLQGLESFPANADGSFASMALPAGRFLLTFVGSLGYPAKVLLGGLAVRDRGFEMSGSDFSGVTVALMRHALQISGTVVDTKAEPRPEAYIVYFPADRQSWNAWTVRRTRPSRSGKYTLNVSPGKYVVAAVEGGLPEEWRDASYLSKLLPGALEVEVGKTSVEGQELRIMAIRR